MHSRILVAAAFAAVTSVTFMAPSAQAATCVSASVSTYTAGGFSCDYNGLTFSGMSINTIGLVTLGNITPFTIVVGGVSEFGLSLNYSANTNGPNTTADVAWVYNVSGNLLTDAYLSLAAVVTGTGTATAGETLSNGVTLSLTGPGSTTVVFTPIGSLGVIKDQNDFAGTDGSSSSSILTNAFSLTTTPLPAAVWMFGSVIAGAGGVAGWRRKSKAA